MADTPCCNNNFKQCGHIMSRLLIFLFNKKMGNTVMKKNSFLQALLMPVSLSCALIGGAAFADSSDPGIPTELQGIYSSTLNSTVSDEFNDSSLDLGKWQYRWASAGDFATEGATFKPVNGSALLDSGDTSTYLPYVDIKTKGSTSFVAVRGSHNDNKGSGITTYSKTQYGFYVMRWNTQGIDSSAPSRWHPAVWAAGCDFSVNNACIPQVKSKAQRLEIDFMEAKQSNSSSHWDSHILGWNGSSTLNLNLKSVSTTFPQESDDEWELMGLEYNPSYLRLWLHNDITGWEIHKTLAFNSGASTGTSYNNLYRTPIYWILSNKQYSVSAAGAQDSALNVDFFRVYDHVSGEYNAATSNPNIVTNISDIDPAASYQFKSAHSSTLLTLEQGSAKGNSVAITNEVPGSVEQEWKFIQEGSYFNVKSAHSDLYLRCYQGNSNANGKNITVHDSVNNNWGTLRWQPVFLYDGTNPYFRMTCKHGGKNLRAYDPFGLPRSGDGGLVTVQSPYQNWATMKWTIIKVD